MGNRYRKDDTEKIVTCNYHYIYMMPMGMSPMGVGPATGMNPGMYPGMYSPVEYSPGMPAGMTDMYPGMVGGVENNPYPGGNADPPVDPPLGFGFRRPFFPFFPFFHFPFFFPFLFPFFPFI